MWWFLDEDKQTRWHARSIAEIRQQVKAEQWLSEEGSDAGTMDAVIVFFSLVGSGSLLACRISALAETHLDFAVAMKMVNIA